MRRKRYSPEATGERRIGPLSSPEERIFVRTHLVAALVLLLLMAAVWIWSAVETGVAGGIH